MKCVITICCGRDLQAVWGVLCSQDAFPLGPRVGRCSHRGTEVTMLGRGLCEAHGNCNSCSWMVVESGAGRFLGSQVTPPRRAVPWLRTPIVDFKNGRLDSTVFALLGGFLPFQEQISCEAIQILVHKHVCLA